MIVSTFRLATAKDADQLADLRWRLQTDDAETFDTSQRKAFVSSLTSFPLDSLADYSHWIAEWEGRLVVTKRNGWDLVS